MKKVSVKNLLKPKEVFAEGLSFYKVFLIFVFGCIFGTYYEQILKLIADGVWVTQQGVIYGPFNPVYGFGAAGLIVLLVRKTRKWYWSFLLAAIVAGFFEYLLHELEYIFTGNVSWDYTYLKLYIPSIATKGATAGTSVLHMAIWGALGLFLEYIVYPIFSKLIEKIPPLQGKMVCNALVVFLTINILLTGAVFLRYGERQKGKEPITFIGAWLDRNYPDEYVYEIFPDKKLEETENNNET
jgi:uncharacterized membrane protein